MAKNVVTIPQKITKGEELVVIPRSLYEAFSRWEKQRKKKEKVIDEIIALGEKELKEGKTIIARSSKEASKKFYAKNQ